MAYFADANDVYRTLGRLFEELASDDEAGARFRSANTIVRYEYRDPDAAITVRLEPDGPADVEFGESSMEAEIVMAMDADTGHLFWLGEVNVTLALARGQIKASGPVAKILRLVPLAKPIFPRYKALLEEMGREDLLDV